MARYAVGAETLGMLGKQTSTATQDLGQAVRNLARAGDPVQDDFQGAGKAAFLEFHGRTDEIAVGLNRALASVLEGVRGMDAAFLGGEAQQADETRAAMGGVSFDAARFSGSRVH